MEVSERELKAEGTKGVKARIAKIENQIIGVCIDVKPCQ